MLITLPKGKYKENYLPISTKLTLKRETNKVGKKSKIVDN